MNHLIPRAAVLAVLCWAVWAALPPALQAGGREFASGGARGLGRGGASFLRADDPSVMVLNPAMLADLPDHMAIADMLLTVPDACVQPTGGFDWASGPDDVVLLDKEQGPLYMQAPGVGTLSKEQYVDADTGKKLVGYYDEPLPKSCYAGGIRVFPSAALSAKIGDKLGLGLGFMPPDDTAVDYWGNGDGTVDTPNGKRPDITRYMANPIVTTYFGLLGGIGYRIAPWLRLGMGLRWSMVVMNTKSYSNVEKGTMSPVGVNRALVYGKDLFIPGLTASVHAVPVDALDVALGFRWEDRVRMEDAKVDVITHVWGLGRQLSVKQPDGTIVTLDSGVPYENSNLPGRINAPPILVPQLTLGIRYADRIRPRDYHTRKKFTEEVRDSMSDERWDVEANFIYYINSVNDRNMFYSFEGENKILFHETDPNLPEWGYEFGRCPKYDKDGLRCVKPREVEVKLAGKNQIGLRLGGDYNVVPGVFSVRAGVSWDSRGVNPDYASVQNMNFMRTGLHAGLTVRLDKNTDVTIGYAHFFYETLEVQINPESNLPATEYMDKATAEKYHVKYKFDENGKPVGFLKLDGISKVGFFATDRVGPPYVNAGTYRYNLDVVGASIAQHF